MKTLISILFALLSSVAFAGSTINGAGATFPYPLYAKWATAYEAEPGIKLNYQSITIWSRHCNTVDRHRYLIRCAGTG